MSAMETALKAPEADRLHWHFAPGLGFTAAFIALYCDDRPIALAPMEPRDHELVRKWGRGVAVQAGYRSPLSVTLELPDNLDRYARIIAMPTNVPQAKQVLQYADQFGRCHIEFFDANGEALGRATMDADQYAQFIGDGCDVLSIAKQGGLAIEPHLGEA